MKPRSAEECKPRGWQTGGMLAGAAALLAAAGIAACYGNPGRATEDANCQRMPVPIVVEASGWVRSIYDNNPLSIM